MEIKSPCFKNNELIPTKYTNDGINVNPELIIDQIPKNSKILVLVIEDPDSIMICGYTWIHWVVFNIPVNGKDKITIKEDSIPGLYGKNSYKSQEYKGPSPPKGSGIHHYYFKVYALDKELDLQRGASLEHIEKEMKEHIIDKAELVGVYFRQ